MKPRHKATTGLLDGITVDWRHRQIPPVEAYLRARSRTAIGYLFDPVTQSLYRAFRER